MGETKRLEELLEEEAESMRRDPLGGLVMHYGMPPPHRPMKPKPPAPDTATDPLPAMPPITHNPFTGEPVNLLEVLAQNAHLSDEVAHLKKQYEELDRLAGNRLKEIGQLKLKAAELEEHQRFCPRDKSQAVPRCAFPGGCKNKPLKNLTMCGKHQPFPAKKW
jgi:hypothetical protein